MAKLIRVWGLPVDAKEAQGDPTAFLRQVGVGARTLLWSPVQAVPSSAQGHSGLVGYTHSHTPSGLSSLDPH